MRYLIGFIIASGAGTPIRYCLFRTSGVAQARLISGGRSLRSGLVGPRHIFAAGENLVHNVFEDLDSA
jgi:hypothetical protein